MFKHKPFKTWFITAIVLVVLGLVINIVTQVALKEFLNLVLDAGKPIYAEGEGTIPPMYKAETSSKADAYEKANATNIEVCEEGFILLKNDNNTLPIEKNLKVSIFGKNSTSMAFSGGGSGSFVVDPDSALYKRMYDMGIVLDYIDIYGGLKDYFTLNPVLEAFYKDNSKSGDGRSNANTDLDSGDDKQFSVGETPIDKYTNDIRASYQDYNDAAFVVITRLGGEGADLPRRQGSTPGANSPTDHYLELDKNEIDMFNEVTEHFDKVIVFLNIASSMEVNFMYDTLKYPFADKIDACIFIGYTGKQGIKALGPILTGEVNPSGKTVDTWAKDLLSAPSTVNFGTGTHPQDAPNKMTFDQYYTDSSMYYFVNYEEGIYVGYRYYETRGLTDGDAWYNANVQYPFGYGLSYTTFDWTVSAPTGEISKNSKLTFNVTVKNTGTKAGKDTVQIYASAPYIEDEIEKAHKVLVGFSKTKLLNPGESDTLTIEVDPYTYASYDYRDYNYNDYYTYELDPGTYTFYVASTSHDDRYHFDKELADLIVYEEDPVTGNPVGNRFTTDGVITDVNFLNDSDQGLDTVLSRIDWEDTWPTEITDDDRHLDEMVWDELKVTTPNNPTKWSTIAMPEHDLEPTVLVKDLLPTTTPEATYLPIVSYNDPKWDAIVKSMNTQELVTTYNQAAYQTRAMQEVGLPQTMQADGPSGFTCFLNKDRVCGTTQYASEPIFAATWNVDLIEKLGKAMGEEGIWGYDKTNQPYSAIYAPGVNIHRSQFGGRCSEYMSEDPYLTGMIAAYEIRGLQSRGVTPSIKHFVANEQETHRSVTGDCSWLTEQSLRELYLKPFEIAVKVGGCRGLMTSFNRVGAVWTGGDYRLCTEILREEWGFRGAVICDFNTVPSYMIGKQMAYAGGDLNLQTSGGGTFKADLTNAADVTVLLKAGKNIAYTVANSNAFCGEIIGYTTPKWIVIMYIVDAVVLAGLAAWGAIVIIKFKKVA